MTRRHTWRPAIGARAQRAVMMMRLSIAGGTHYVMLPPHQIAAHRKRPNGPRRARRPLCSPLGPSGSVWKARGTPRNPWTPVEAPALLEASGPRRTHRPHISAFSFAQRPLPLPKSLIPHQTLTSHDHPPLPGSTVPRVPLYISSLSVSSLSVTLHDLTHIPPWLPRSVSIWAPRTRAWVSSETTASRSSPTTRVTAQPRRSSPSPTPSV